MSEWRSSLKGMETNDQNNVVGDKQYGVRMEVFPERDGNKLKIFATNSRYLVRMEVFPERDGNFNLFCRFDYTNQVVRMEVFPERDGNVKLEQ